MCLLGYAQVPQCVARQAMTLLHTACSRRAGTMSNEHYTVSSEQFSGA